MKVVGLFSAMAVVAAFIVWTVERIRRPVHGSPEELIIRADELAWNNNWSAAAPFYARAEGLFIRKGDLPHALYARVSRVPVLMETTSLPSLIAELNEDLELVSASQSDVRLRILEVKGRCEEEYNAGLAAQTFRQVELLALAKHDLYLASRASGERGVMLFTLGELDEAGTLVKRAYGVAKYLHDPAGHVRFASIIGMGLSQMGRPAQALTFLDEAILTQKKYPQVASPDVAINAKVDCLSALGRNTEALSLVAAELGRLKTSGRLGPLQALLTSRATVLMRVGRTKEAVNDYHEALRYAIRLSAWRAITDINAGLAEAYRRSGNLLGALSVVNDAIRANSQAPGEIFLVPGNFALKAKILTEMGKPFDAESVYQKGAQMVDVLLSAVPTPEIEESVLAQMGTLYAGYFQLLSDEGRLSDAFQVIERGRGRTEEQHLTFNKTAVPERGSDELARIQEFAMRLLDATDGRSGQMLQQANMLSSGSTTVSDIKTASLRQLQDNLHKGELLVEYILADPTSFGLVITRSTAKRYTLPSKDEIERDADAYRRVMLERSSDQRRGRKLFDELLPFLDGYPDATSVIAVGDGDLHLLPFSALVQGSGQYLAQTKTVTMTPSGTVLCMLRDRTNFAGNDSKWYLGVAPWVDEGEQGRWVLAKRGAERTLLTPLPDTRDEVESVAAMMPDQATVLIGREATKEKFEALPLHNYRVLHLAMHGLIDTVFPDRSALVFVPTDKDDGRLEARDIRGLHLQADLVTLSACNTAVGPATSAGVESLHAAFIQAGANSVVSSLWEVDDPKADTLMKSFYRHLRAEDKASALRDAEVDLMKDNVSPYYWAAFEIVGDPSGSPLSATNQVTQW